MESAFRTTASALGVCAACYLLSTASWQQVLLLFMVAGFGWCWFSTFAGASSNRSRAPQSVPGQSGLVSRTAVSAANAIAEQQRETTPECTAGRPRSLPPKARRQARTSSPSETKSNSNSDYPGERVQKVYRFPMHQLSRQSLTPALDCE